MNTLKNKSYNQYDYLSRYSNTPIYFDTLDNRYISGIGSNLFLNTPAVTHKVTATDTLDYLALKYYGNPTFWWVIAYFNNIQDAFVNLQEHFSILKIPEISAIAFGKEN